MFGMALGAELEVSSETIGSEGLRASLVPDDPFEKRKPSRLAPAGILARVGAVGVPALGSPLLVSAEAWSTTVSPKHMTAQPDVGKSKPPSDELAVGLSTGATRFVEAPVIC